MDIGKLEMVPLREAFPHEARNLTKWLEKNIDALAERVGMELQNVEREKPVGSFTVDLFCEDQNQHFVIIENQLKLSDHDHLGKLLTYMVNLDAHTAIWVTPEVRPEHERVIDWLNEHSGADFAFYLVRLEAVRIGESPYAPLFTVLAGPDAQTREIGETKKELADRHVKRREFWQGLLDKSRGKTTLFASISPGIESWISTSAGRSGLSFNYLILMDHARIELYIDSADQARNKAFFEHLYKQKEAIEGSYGGELRWQRLDEKRACRISREITGKGGLMTPESWDRLQDYMIQEMIKFHEALHGRIAEIKI